jgi:Arc/MetJ-type ribon-helix-helix transcriptional regulator
VEKMAADRIDEEVRSAFPQGTIQQVQMQEYGDDPEIEPGQIGIRVFIQPPPQPGAESGLETFRQFVRAHRETVYKLHRDLPSIGWIDLRLGGGDHGLGIRTAPGRQIRLPGEAAEELTSVMTRLGPEDLATVDTLITAGIANSRAEVLRWALGRIREHPAYAQIQERVGEISQLKAQF